MTWEEFHCEEKKKDYYKELEKFIKEEYSKYTCYPSYENIFKAFKLTPYDKVQCVILGQDPYHEPNQAMGLAFSVPTGITLPRSLKNIYKEIQNEYGYPISDNGDLTKWAEQGVFMLNTVLTVREHQADSHANHGWEIYTDAVIRELNRRKDSLVFILWGNKARSKKELISDHHLVLESPHPSPFSARKGFFGNNHFKECNKWLEFQKKNPIDWQIN